MADGGQVVIRFTGDTKALLASVNQVKGHINSINRGMGTRLQSGITRATSNMTKFDKSVKATAKSAHGLEIGFNQMYRTLFNVKTIALVLFGGMVKSIIKADAEAQGLRATLQAVVKDDNIGEELFNSLSAFARRMPIDTGTAIKEYVKLFNRGLRPTTMEFERLIDLSSALGGGDLTNKFSIISKALGDVAAKGRLMGQEVRQFSEAGLNIREIIGLIPRLGGKDVAGDYAAAKITFEEFYKALLKFSKDNFEGVAAKKMQTLEGSLAVFADTIFRIKRAIGTGGVSPALQEFLNSISKTFVETGVGGSDAATDLLNWGKSFGNVLKALLGTVTILYGWFTKMNNAIHTQGTFMSSLVMAVTDFAKIMLIATTPIIKLINLLTTSESNFASIIGYIVGLSLVTGIAVKTLIALKGAFVLVTKAMRAFTVEALLGSIKIVAVFALVGAALIGLIKSYQTLRALAKQKDFIETQRLYSEQLQNMSAEMANLIKLRKKATEEGDTTSIDIISARLSKLGKTIKEVTDLSNGLAIDYDKESNFKTIQDEMAALQKGFFGNTGINEFADTTADIKKEIRDILGQDVSENMINILAKDGLSAQQIIAKLGEDYVKFSENLTKDIFKMRDGWTQFGEAGKTAIMGLDTEFSNFIDNGTFDLQGLVEGFVKDLAKIAWQQLVTAPLLEAMNTGLSAITDGDPQKSIFGVISKVVGGIAGAAFGAKGSITATPGVKPAFLPNAKGNAFSKGSVTPFAKGGVVSSPTTFGMSGGGTGLMGEAGPEAIMPLTRSADGSLGVNASSMAPTIIINTPPGTTAETRTNSDNTTEIFIKRFNATLGSSDSDGSFQSANFRNSEQGVQAA